MKTYIELTFMRDTEINKIQKDFDKQLSKISRKYLAAPIVLGVIMVLLTVAAICLTFLTTLHLTAAVMGGVILIAALYLAITLRKRVEAADAESALAMDEVVAAIEDVFNRYTKKIQTMYVYEEVVCKDELLVNKIVTPLRKKLHEEEQVAAFCYEMVQSIWDGKTDVSDWIEYFDSSTKIS